ncbi:MAG TPA: indolepyruvate/phenylpyruvate decarboxylase [Usitatibacter sp.]|nr:indolepyruvate/phenylpyruvate decarboxylase [Usitatibacter sp.]
MDKVRTEATVGGALIEALHASGAREVFGIPGDFALPFFDALERMPLLRLVTLSNEPSLGFAADAAARIRGAPSVVAVTYGAGALNAVNPVACAYAEKSPVVVISGAAGSAARASGLRLHHEVKRPESQFEIYREITCDQARLDDPALAASQVARVLAAARRWSRPVYIELPADCVGAPSAGATALPQVEADPDALESCAQEILARLDQAKHPVLMVGVEVRRFGLEKRVAELARTLRIPVVTSFLGRGLLSDTDAPLAGTYLGVAGDPGVTALVEDSDGLFLLGEIWCDTNFGVSRRRIDPRRTIQALDTQVTISHHVYPDIPLADLVAALERLARPVAQAERLAPPSVPSGMPHDGAPITPDDIAAALNDLMNEHGRFPVAADVGDCLFTAMDLVHTDHVAPGYYATMGFGVPAGIGVQVATGRRPIILVGDGAFQMTGMELGHCARLGLDPIVVVFNNAQWGMLTAFRPEAHYTRLGTWDLAAVGQALGGRGHRAASRAQLAAALDDAARRRGTFQLIDARIAPGALSPMLRRFAAAVSRA